MSGKFLYIVVIENKKYIWHNGNQFKGLNMFFLVIMLKWTNFLSPIFDFWSPRSMFLKSSNKPSMYHRIRRFESGTQFPVSNRYQPEYGWRYMMACWHVLKFFNHIFLVRKINCKVFVKLNFPKIMKAQTFIAHSHPKFYGDSRL